jgi:hypothetical protein
MQRKLRAIMFTDIVGYTALMQESEAKAVLLREAHRKIFDSTTQLFDGEIIQYYGDGTLSVFESALDAVNCGISLQLQFQKDSTIPVRIGLHMGDIIISDKDIIGDAVNLASRVESMGVAGSVLITEKVQQEIYNKENIETISLGKFQFKNDQKKRTVFAINQVGLVVPKPSQLSKNPLDKKGEFLQKRRRKNTIRIASILGILSLGIIIGNFWVSRNKKIKKAHTETVPEIVRLMENINVVSTIGGTGANIWPAYLLYEEASKYISNDKSFMEIGDEIFQPINLTSEPSGAKIWAF